MKRFALRIGGLTAAVVLASALLFGDGGTLQFRKPAGPFVISVFSEPVPVRAGPADLSVMVEKAIDQSAVQDADVRLHLKKTESGNIIEIEARATHEHATNKLMYAATMNLPSVGMWQMTVDVSRKGDAAAASAWGELNVLAAEPPLIEHWPLFAVVPLMMLFFVLNQWLKTRRGKGRGRLQG